MVPDNNPAGQALPKDSVVRVTAPVTLGNTELSTETRQLRPGLVGDVERGHRGVHRLSPATVAAITSPPSG
jgi:hypothetical protein